MTRSQFAQLMGIGVRQVDQLRQAGVIEPEPDGSWDLVAIMQLLFHFKQRAMKAERLLRRIRIID
jgi:hypothetical protein